MGRAIEPSSPAEEYHELRKKGKELRYLLELFGVKLFDEEAVAPLVKSLKALQELLGRHQDREVQIAMLRSSVEEVATLPGGGGRVHGHGCAGGAAARRRAGRPGRVRRALRRARRPAATHIGSRDFSCERSYSCLRSDLRCHGEVIGQLVFKRWPVGSAALKMVPDSPRLREDNPTYEQR